MRTRFEISEELAALKSLVPSGPMPMWLKAQIFIAIEELELGVDDTAEEWHELTESERYIVRKARDWIEATVDESPSTYLSAQLAKRRS